MIFSLPSKPVVSPMPASVTTYSESEVSLPCTSRPSRSDLFAGLLGVPSVLPVHFGSHRILAKCHLLVSHELSIFVLISHWRRLEPAEILPTLPLAYLAFSVLVPNFPVNFLHITGSFEMRNNVSCDPDFEIGIVLSILPV